MTELLQADIAEDIDTPATSVVRGWSGRRIVWCSLVFCLSVMAGFVIVALLHRSHVRQTIRNAGGSFRVAAKPPWWLEWAGESDWLEVPELLQPVTDLYLTDCQMTDHVWRGVLQICGPELNVATLHEHVSDAQLRQFTERSPELSHLVAGGSRLTRSGLSSLLNCPRLEMLSLDSVQSTGRTLDVLPRLKQLEFLYLHDGELHAADLQAISQCHQLFYLTCTSIRFPETGADAIGHFPHLQHLHFEGSRVSDEFVSRFASCPKLQFIGLENSAVSGACLEDLATMPELISLNLAGTRLEEQNLRHLPDLVKTISLDLSNTTIGDTAIPFLLQCGRLTHLYLDGTRVSAEGLEQLREKLPDCRIAPKAVGTQ